MSIQVEGHFFVLTFLLTSMTSVYPYNFQHQQQQLHQPKSRTDFYNAGQYDLKDCPTQVCRCESWPYSNRTDLHCPKDLSSIPSLSADSGMQFNWVFLNGARIKKLSVNAFFTFHATRINLSGNKLGSKGSFPVGSFVTANGNHLRELVLTQNSLQEIPCKALDLPWLESLDLGSNLITELRRECFHSLKELQTLKLDRNKISTIRNGAFKNLVKLGILDLSHNDLKSLKRGHLRGLVSLNQLRLSNNQLSSIEPSSFKAVKKLQMLDLQTNAFKKLEVGIFRGLKMLRELSLRDNDFMTIEDGTFATTRRLRSLTFDMTSVESLGNMTFAGLKGLTNLVLGEVGREFFPEGLLGHSPRLRKIDLTNYNSGFKGVNLDCLSAKVKLNKLVIQVTPLYECSCDLSWIKLLTRMKARVKGQCYNIMQLSCPNHPHK